MFLRLPDLAIHGKRAWRLKSTLIYRSEMLELTILVPTGFITDLASIPRALQWLIPVNGRHRAAAIVHDYLYCKRGQLPGGETASRKEADQVFKEAMKSAGVNWFTRQTMYAAVRGFGWTGW